MYFVLSVLFIALLAVKSSEGKKFHNCFCLPLIPSLSRRLPPERFASVIFPMRRLRSGGMLGEGRDEAGWAKKILKRKKIYKFDGKILEEKMRSCFYEEMI
jgi:hypothetical protein